MSYGLADVDSLNAGNRKNIAWTADGFIDAFETFEGVQLRNFCLLNGAAELDDAHFVADIQRSIEHTGDGQPAEIIAVIQIRDEDL